MEAPILSAEEIYQVVLLISEVEKSIQYPMKQLNMTKQQIMDSVFATFDIPPPITEQVLEMLQEQKTAREMMLFYMENCFQREMTKYDTMDDLFYELQIPKAFTKIVWETLERKNPEVFQAYYARLEMVDQALDDFNGQSGMENMTLNGAPSGSGSRTGVEPTHQNEQAQEQPNPTTEEVKMDPFEDDDEFEDFRIDESWKDKEGSQPWEDEWEDDDDDDDDDFSQLLKNELERNNPEAN